MTKFNKGDKVRFNDKSNTAWYGVEGIVENNNNTYNNNTLRLTIAPTGWASNYKVGDEARISDHYLELVETPFTFKDIQKGDTIRRTATYKGATEVREGVVGSKGSYYWAAEQGNYILAYDTDDAPKDVTLELLNRPEPEPTLLEGTKTGDQLVLTLHNGVSKVYTKKADGDWSTLVFKNGDYSHIGFTWEQDNLERQVESAKSHKLIKA